ncbi:MAG: DUF418 domain-containing protein [Spirochaetes bacterium]|nr:DUF418 domain-containing protein [Spirochaetota bacterium]
MYMIAGTAWALSVISICLLVGNVLHDRLNWLARCGQMALTHYVFHSVVVLGLFEAFDGIAARSGYFVFGLSITVFLIMLFFSNVWLKFFRRGPLELLMRRLS